MKLRREVEENIKAIQYNNGKMEAFEAVVSTPPDCNCATARARGQHLYS